MFEKMNFSSENENFSENDLEENNEKNLASNKSNDESKSSDTTDNNTDSEKNLDDSQKDKESSDIVVEEETNYELQSLRDEKLRLLAEMENLRKRFEKEKSDSIKYGNINLARDALSIYDNLVRALDMISETKDLPEFGKNMLGGLKMVQKEFMTVLERHGVTEIKIGKKEKFDPNLHQAIKEIEVKEEAEEGFVGNVSQTGFMMHDRLLRPAMVGVTKMLKMEKKGEKK